MYLKRCISILLILFFNLSFSQVSSFDDQDCLSCHGKSDISQITIEGKLRSLFVNPEEWSQDIHRNSKMTCVDCHTNANPYIHFREGFIDVDCAHCHPEEAEEYQKNIHLTFPVPSKNKEFPLCYHCHTKHHILPHDNPASSVHEENVGETCGACHPEVMVKGILKGTSLGKISGHRKGNLEERFGMNVCISCHYEDSAHGAKRVYKDFCSRCHDVRSKGNFVMGSTHLDSQRWVWLNYTSGSLVILFFIGALLLVGYKSRKGIVDGVKTLWHGMKIKEKESPKTEQADKEEEHKE